MTRNFYTLFLFIFCCSFTALAYSNNKIENSKEDDFDVNETIMHHIKDSHDFHILDWNGHPVSVPLPVILWTNEGLVAFMSSEFHHDDSGATVVKRKNQTFVKFHEEIYYAGNNKEGKYIHWFNAQCYYSFSESTYKRPSGNRVKRFQEFLKSKGYVVTIRSTRGDDIMAACGQLVGKVNDRTGRKERKKKKELIKTKSI